jgi:hypothetical protein
LGGCGEEDAAGAARLPGEHGRIGVGSMLKDVETLEALDAAFQRARAVIRPDPGPSWEKQERKIKALSDEN